MKKILLLLSLIILAGCHNDDDFVEIFPEAEVPVSLQIKGLIGIKLENTICSSTKLDIKYYNHF